MDTERSVRVKTPKQRGMGERNTLVVERRCNAEEALQKKTRRKRRGKER